MLQEQLYPKPTSKTQYPPVSPGYAATQHFGRRWETWAAEQLEALGYHVTTPPDYFTRYDLRIARPGHAPTLHVEVKAARLSWRRVRAGYYRPRYQFDLTGGLNRDKLDFLYILIALSESTGEITPFIVPSYALGHRRHAQITSDPAAYRGRLLAEFRHNWDIVSDVYDIRRRYQFAAAGQLSLFANVTNSEVIE